MEEVNDDMFEEKTVIVTTKSLHDQLQRERTMTKRSRVRFTQVERGVKDLESKGSDRARDRTGSALPWDDEASPDAQQTTTRPESPGERRVCVAGLLASGKDQFGRALPRKMFGRPSSPLGPRGLSVVGGDIRTSIARSAAASTATSRRGAFEGKRLPTAFARGPPVVASGHAWN